MVKVCEVRTTKVTVKDVEYGIEMATVSPSFNWPCWVANNGDVRWHAIRNYGPHTDHRPGADNQWLIGRTLPDQSSGTDVNQVPDGHITRANDVWPKCHEIPNDTVVTKI